MTVAATSHSAKRSITKGVSKKHKRQILEYVMGRGKRGATIEEIQIGTGIKLQTVCARRKELDDKGFVVDSGLRRPTTSGRTATVWVAPIEVTKSAIRRGWKIERT